MMQPIYDFGGRGADLHLAVANGFPPLTYAPLLTPLLNDYHAFSLPPRALWSDEKPPAALHLWDAVADDLLAGLEQHGYQQVIAVGHSFGGIASILAALRQPERFRALILLDPTLLLPEWWTVLDGMLADGTIGDFPLAAGALRRRRRFDSVQAAYDYFRPKPLFAQWSDSALRLYTECGLRPAAEGGVELVWSPEWEAYYFMTGYSRCWEALAGLRGRLPVLALRGQTSDTFVAPGAELFRQALPEATLIEIPDHGHLFPHTTPDSTAQHMRDWLAALP
jgi:pimeloyl-ACP methyl ester carboxylesterase